VIALTFDDGPDLHTTPQLMKQLDMLGIRATMFLVGDRCLGKASLLRECTDAGHVLALHGYSHQSFLLRSGGWQRTEIERSAALLSEMNIMFEPLFRPPFGRFNPATGSVLVSLKMTGVMWTQIAHDWKHQSRSRLEARLFRQLSSGNIVLLHDAHSTTPEVINVLPRLAETVQERGWRFVTLSNNHLPQHLHL
jgi:peptidoglycan/xylan/chitin deacetylase (PgdA/CDA1 family)